MSSEFNQRGSGTPVQPGTLNADEIAYDVPRRISVEDLDTKSEKRQSQLDTRSASEEERIEITVYDGNPSDDRQVKLDVKSDDEGEDTPTLRMTKQQEAEMSQNAKISKVPIQIFPLSRLELAWTSSSNVAEFVFKAISIIFSTVGWLCCVGGVPLMSLVMLIMGSIYIDDCTIQPMIPAYLVVSGLFGTIQHFVGVWTKYIPEESQGRMRVYRAYCKVIDHSIQGFLLIWFILGCIWVYGVHDTVQFRKFYVQEYCNKTVYYFAFWILNISFFFMSILAVVTMAAVLHVALSKEKVESKA